MGILRHVKPYFHKFMEKYPTNQPSERIPKSVNILILGQIGVIILTHTFIISDHSINPNLAQIGFLLIVFSLSCYYRTKAINAGRGVIVHNTAELFILSSVVLFGNIVITLLTISIHIFSHFLFGLRNPHQLSFNFANEFLSGSVVFVVYTKIGRELLSISDVHLIFGSLTLTLVFYLLNNIQTILVVWLVSGQNITSVIRNSYDKKEEVYIIGVSTSAIIFTFIAPNLYPIIFILIFALFIQQISREEEINRQNKAKLELKQLQHDAEIREQEERELEKLKVLSGKVAHDIRNYLFILYGDIEMMSDKIPDKRKERMRTSVSNINEIVDYLFDFSAGNSLVLTNIEINSFVKNIVELNLMGSGNNYEFRGLKEDKMVKIDSTKMKQVLSNIIINAKEAINGEIGRIQIDLDVIENDNSVSIRIKDNGAGIAKEDQKKIFDPFFSTKQRGSGLGLTTANHIILAHNGSLKFESEIGVGTEFTISLPVEIE